MNSHSIAFPVAKPAYPVPAKFANQLAATAAPLTASEAALAVSPLLSRRTMEDWLQDRRTPPDWTHAYIIAAVTRAASRKIRRRAANTQGEPRLKAVGSTAWLDSELLTLANNEPTK